MKNWASYFNYFSKYVGKDICFFLREIVHYYLITTYIKVRIFSVPRAHNFFSESKS